MYDNTINLVQGYLMYVQGDVTFNPFALEAV